MMMVGKLCAALQTLYGWICAAAIFLVNIFDGYETAVISVAVCVALDTVWGIAAQVKTGRFTLSELGRAGMLSKWLLYASAIIAFIHIERMAGIDSHISVIVVCSLISIVEVWSMSGSALIINPRMPFLRLFRRVLIGEIAHKMDVEPEKVEEMFNNLDRDDTRSDNNGSGPILHH